MQNPIRLSNTTRLNESPAARSLKDLARKLGELLKHVAGKPPELHSSPDIKPPHRWPQDARSVNFRERETMHYEQLSEVCFAAAIGEGGLRQDRFDEVIAETKPILEKLRRHHQAGDMALLNLPAAREDLPALQRTAERLRTRFDRLILLGTGGSSLAGQALVALKRGPADSVPGGTALSFLDNADPHSFAELFRSLDVERTGFLVISKSGTTPETLTQTLVCLGAMRSALSDEALAEHFVVITEPGENPLRRLAARFGFEVHDHDPNIGGRFSALSCVGLLPAMVAGLDGSAVRAGAASVLDATLNCSDPRHAPPAEGAAIGVGLLRHCGVTVSVLMPYADRLAPFGLWYRQLWAESLGKNGIGVTPIAALGPVDQHSQLQLYLDGPRDKMFSLLTLDSPEEGSPIEAALAEEIGLGYLAGRTIADLVAAEARATAETLAKAGRPTRILRLSSLDEETLGALMMHFMLETIIAAGLLGVNPFDQPAVERGKELARNYLEEMP